MNDDFPEKEPARVWIVAGVFLAAITLVFVMLVYTSTQAHAQQMLCAPADVFIKQMVEVKKQRPVWEGTVPLPENHVAEALIMQSEKEWSFFVIHQGQACLMAAGIDANPPIETDDGA